MRKVKQKNVDKKVRNNSSGKADSRAPQKLDSIDDDDLGFSGWLRFLQATKITKVLTRKRIRSLDMKRFAQETYAAKPHVYNIRSPQGLENMKLFVIANSIVLLTTLGLPHVQSVIEIIVQVVFGGDY